MENLVSREAYDLDETGIQKRLPVVGGLFAFLFGGLFFGFAFPMVFQWLMAFVIPLPTPFFNAPTVLVAGLSFGVLFGLTFGLLFPARFRKKMASVIDAIYNGDTKIVQLPPPENEFLYRMPCSWMKSDNFSVGGVLYLGKQSFLFVPHKKNLPIHRDPFEITPINEVTLSVVEPHMNLLLRLL